MRFLSIIRRIDKNKVVGITPLPKIVQVNVLCSPDVKYDKSENTGPFPKRKTLGLVIMYFVYSPNNSVLPDVILFNEIPSLVPIVLINNELPTGVDRKINMAAKNKTIVDKVMK